MPLNIRSSKDVFSQPSITERERIELDLEEIRCSVCGTLLGIKIRSSPFLIIGNTAIQLLPKGKIICGGCGKCTIWQDYRARVVQIKSRTRLLDDYFLGLIKYIVKNKWGW
jgi:hypothetical protein